MTTVPDKVRKAYQELPPSWRLEKLKFFADVRNSNVDKTIAEDEEPVRLCNYTDVYYNDRITSDLPFMEGSATIAEIKQFQLKQGQVIITKDSEGWDDIGIPALVTEDMPDVLCGYHLSVFKPSQELDGSYLAWLCRAEPLNGQFKIAANGVTRFGLGQYPMKNAFVALPPIQVQRRIANFLDEKTAQIDGLFDKKRMLLERLADKRQALIIRAVTRGLDPNVSMKSSGIDGLGDVPAHWETKRLNSFCDFVSGKAHEPFVDSNGEYVCVNARFISTNGLTEKRCTENLCPAKPGDILMVMSDLPNGRALARSFLVNNQAAYAVNQRVCRIRLRAGLSDYFSYQLNRNAQLLKYNDGKEQTHLSNLVFKHLLLLKPPEEEQRQIVIYLDQSIAALKKMEVRVEKTMTLLEEYRSAIIAAAVTGKIGDLQ